MLNWQAILSNDEDSRYNHVVLTREQVFDLGNRIAEHTQSIEGLVKMVASLKELGEPETISEYQGQISRLQTLIDKYVNIIRLNGKRKGRFSPYSVKTLRSAEKIYGKAEKPKHTKQIMKYTVPTVDAYEKMDKVMAKVKDLEKLQTQIKNLETEIDGLIELNGLESFFSKGDFFNSQKPKKKATTRKQSTVVSALTVASVLKTPKDFKTMFAQCLAKTPNLTEEELKTDIEMFKGRGRVKEEKIGTGSKVQYVWVPAVKTS